MQQVEQLRLLRLLATLTNGRRTTPLTPTSLSCHTTISAQTSSRAPAEEVQLQLALAQQQQLQQLRLLLPASRGRCPGRMASTKMT